MVAEELARGAVDVLVQEEWEQKLAKAHASGNKLRIKLGLDPTAPDIHLGHTVVINKLRQFQLAGHQVVLVIGDFTAKIGDPTGKNVTRKPLSPEQIAQNASTYAEQIYKILDRDKTELVYNGSWLDDLSSADMVRLASSVTVAQMLERDDFQKRYSSGQPIALHEFLYPLLQAYDSVVLKADVELGGTDQTFNLLMGRELQKQNDQSPQTVMTMPLLEGLDGVKKMSKSLDNYIGISEAPEEMFGKLMSISDDLMWRYYELLSFESAETIAAHKSDVAAGKNPMEFKFELAREIIERFHSVDAAKAAKDSFIARFRKSEIPDDLELQQLVVDGESLGIAYALQRAGLVGSTSEAIRMIKQGAVKVSSKKVDDKNMLLPVGEEFVLQVGKRRIAKVKIIAS
jgi:tyrosyl-tRNA synthetase